MPLRCVWKKFYNLVTNTELSLPEKTILLLLFLVVVKLPMITMVMFLFQYMLTQHHGEELMASKLITLAQVTAKKLKRQLPAKMEN